MVATLLDTLDLTEKIKLGKVEIEMRGLYAEEIFFLLVDFPALRALFDKTGPVAVTEDDIMKAAPQAVYQAIAMCNVGLPHNDDGRMPADTLAKAADKVRRLPLGHQLTLVRKFFDLTFADGIGPFVAGWMELTSRFNELTTMNQPTQSPDNDPSRKDSRGQSFGSVVVDLPRDGKLRGAPRAPFKGSAISSRKRKSVTSAI